jgi:hypothetical protein
MLCGQLRGLVTQGTARTRPVMGGATRLEQHSTDGGLGEELDELGAIESVVSRTRRRRRAIPLPGNNLLPNQRQGFYASLRTPSVCQLGFRHCQLGTWMPKK